MADYNVPVIEFLLLPILLFLFSMLLYLPTLHSPFLFDDIAILDAMPREYFKDIPYDHPLFLLYDDIRHCSNPFRSRLLTVFSYRLNAYHYGLNPSGWHITGIRIHSLSSLTLYFILMHFFSVPVSFLSALLFSAHPLNTMSISYIAGRSSSLCALFVLLTVLFILSHHPLLSIFPITMAILSKEESVALIPVILALCFI